MVKEKANIWIWLQNGEIYKAISNVENGTIQVYDEQDNLVMKRTGLTQIQVKQIEHIILKYGAKKLDQHAEPFKFL